MIEIRKIVFLMEYGNIIEKEQNKFDLFLKLRENMKIQMNLQRGFQ